MSPALSDTNSTARTQNSDEQEQQSMNSLDNESNTSSQDDGDTSTDTPISIEEALRVLNKELKKKKKKKKKEPRKSKRESADSAADTAATTAATTTTATTNAENEDSTGTSNAVDEDSTDTSNAASEDSTDPPPWTKSESEACESIPAKTIPKNPNAAPSLATKWDFSQRSMALPAVDENEDCVTFEKQKKSLRTMPLSGFEKQNFSQRSVAFSGVDEKAIEKQNVSQRSMALSAVFGKEDSVANVVEIPSRYTESTSLTTRLKSQKRLSTITFNPLQDEEYYNVGDFSNEFSRGDFSRDEESGYSNSSNHQEISAAFKTIEYKKNRSSEFTTYQPESHRDESDIEKFDRLRNLRASEKFETLAKMGEVETYPGDCYSFIAIHSPFKKPLFFFFGVMVFCFQVLFLMYMILQQMSKDLGLTGEVDNPQEGINFPSNVTGLVRATQITAVLSYIVFADASLRDCATAVEKFPNLQHRQRDDRVVLAIVSSVLRFTQGFLAIIATLLLIVTSDNVIDIILNFAAVNFISTLDEVAFELAKWGKYGPALEREAKNIQHKPIPFCIYRKHHHKRYLLTVLPIAILLLTLTGLIVFFQVSEKYWLTQTVRVQFAESTGLQLYSGCFDVDTNSTFNKRKNYKSVEVNEKQAVFGYCKDDRQWKLFKAENEEQGEGGEWTNDPCEVTRENELAYSLSADYFDIYTSTEDSWFSADGTPLDLYFFKSEKRGLDLEETCGSFLNNGKCDEFFNEIEYQYDGGDCCASTCQHADCGREGTDGIFGSNNGTQGIGFNKCKDPSLVPMTIYLNKISSSRDPSFLEVTEDQEAEFKAERGCDYWDEPPVTALFNVDCDSSPVLSMYIDDTMEAKSETILVEDGAHCEISVRNSTGIDQKWDNTPIWWIDYTIYHGKNNTNEIISGFSGEQEVVSFERIPECYFLELVEHINVSTAYTANTDLTNALFWLIDDASEYSRCEDPFLIERFALSALYHAAPAPTKDPTSTSSLEASDGEDKKVWISKGDHCRSKHINCNNGSVERMAVRKMQDLEGTISTAVGLLTELKRLEYDTNGLTGTIPSEIGRLTKLTGLDIDENKLTGTLPTEFGLFAKMIELDIDNNDLSGTIPTEFGLMTEALEFDMKGNNFTGPIPKEIFALANLQMIQLNDNQLTGTIPSKISGMKKLQGFLLADNYVAGSLPTQIGRLKNLKQLDLKNNRFRGQIPTEIGLMTSLSTLDLRGNQFEGPIPSELGFLTELKELRLEGNRLTGTIPFQITFLQRLVTFTSDDDLVGSIPKDIATLKPCLLCDGDPYHIKVDQTKDIYYQNGAFGIESFSCAELFLKHEDPDELLSTNACEFLEATCVACDAWLSAENATVP